MPPTCSKCSTALNDDARFCWSCGAEVVLPPRSLAKDLQETMGPDYDVMGELGHGGFGVVYLVSDRKHRRYLAVKVMRPEFLVSDALIERFRREIAFASKLEHPNILRPSFSQESDELVYYAMPRIKGMSLTKLLETSGALSVKDAVTILSGVGRGLHHAHTNGVIHRDIKPSNIMIEPGPTPLILDFGVAKGLSKDGALSISISGEILGSPAYMSPEQAEGRTNLDSRTDIYSWGIMGFEMLAGYTPFTGQNIQQILRKHREEAPPDLRAIRSDVPPVLASVIDRALNKDRNRRWRSMATALASLRAVGGS